MPDTHTVKLSGKLPYEALISSQCVLFSPLYLGAKDAISVVRNRVAVSSHSFSMCKAGHPLIST